MLKGFWYILDLETNKIICGFAHCFLDAESDRAYARKKLAILNSETAKISLSESVSAQARNYFDDTKIAYSMALRFKRDKKFSGRSERM